MSKLTYWERRKAQLIFEQMDKAEKQADKLGKVYDEAQKHLTQKADKVFDKFQRDYGLSQTDARKVLADMKDEKTIAKMRKVLEARPADPNINQLLADLDSAAYSFRIKRFENLQKQVDLMHQGLFAEEKRQSDKFYPELMTDSYLKSTFNLQQQTGLGYQFSTLPETEIKRLSASKWYGENYSERIWNNTGELASRLKDEFLVNLMTGRSERDVVNMIADQLESGKNAARRLVRTESAYFHNEMEALSYEEADIEYYRFVAVLDLRTSEKCRSHDGQIYKVSERRVGENYPPLHPWCRSTTIADFDKDYLKNLSRRARDPETGKNVVVPADMTYDEWLEDVQERHERELSKGKYGANLDYVRSNEYVDKLRNHPRTAPIADNIAKVSRRMIQHRNGSPFEDYYLLDVNTGVIKAVSNKARKTKGVIYNDAVKEAFRQSASQSLVSIHNHPSGYPPSLSDLASLQQKSKNNTVAYGLTAGHDGSVYWYTKPNKKIPKTFRETYENSIDKMVKLGYNEVRAQEEVLKKLSEVFEFEFGRID